MALAATGTITTFAGGGSGVPPGGSASATAIPLDSPRNTTFDGAGNYYFSAGPFSAGNRRIFKVSGGLISVRLEDGGSVGAMVADASGNVFFCADLYYVKKVDPSGVVTIIAGTGTAGYNGDGIAATAAMLNGCGGITLVGADVLVSDTFNRRVRRISGGNISTVVGDGTQSYAGDGGPASAAKVNNPGAMAPDGAGGFYFMDTVGTLGGQVRRVDAGGTITLVPGSNTLGPGQATGIARDAAGNLYLSGSFIVAKVDAAGNATIVAGGGVPPPGGGTGIGDGGPATAAMLSFPSGVAVSSAGELHVADTINARVRKVDGAGIITTVAGGGSYVGDGAPATEAIFTQQLFGISIDAADGVLVGDPFGQRMRRIDAAGIAATVAGNGTFGFSGDGGAATSAMLAQPNHAIAAGGSTFIADARNHRIRRVDGAGNITTHAGIGPSGGVGQVNFAGDKGPAIDARIGEVTSLAFDGSGNLYLAEGDPFNHRVRRIAPGGVIDTVAGDGSTSYNGEGQLAVRAGMDPQHIALDAAGNLYLADTNNHRVRRVDASGIISTVAGSGVAGFTGDGGPAVAAQLLFPRGLAFDPSGNLYIADAGNDRIRVVSPDGVINTVAGAGGRGFMGDGGPATAAQFANPQGLAWHASASALLVADSLNRRVRKIAVTDDTPAAFQFTAQPIVALSSVVQSNTVTPTGFAVAAPISVAGGEYSIGCGGTFVTAVGTISPGQSVCVRHATSAQNNATTTTALTVGGVKGLFDSTTQVGTGSFTASPAPMDFGPRWVSVGTAAQQLTITNTGGVAITVHSITTAQPFTLTHNCTSPLAPAATCSAQVSFFPLLPASSSGSVRIQTTAGTQSTAVTGEGNANFVQHYYTSILGRAPDSGGQAFWDAEAARVVTAGGNVNEAWYALAMQFFFSAEYAARARDNDGFVTDLYLTFFDRAPDSGGKAYWAGLLNQGMPREVLLAQFMFSPEFIAFTRKVFGGSFVRADISMVTDFYRGLLVRLPDNTGLAHWLGRFRTARCQPNGGVLVRAEADSISAEFIASSEYTTRNRTNAQFVGDLYNAFLRRGGDLGGVQFWIGRLDSGASTRDELRKAFVGSSEFNIRIGNITNESCLN